MAIILIGANGFISFHTTLLLESVGHRVVPIDVVPRSRSVSWKLRPRVT